MCYNEAAHVNQSETPAGTEVTALRSARVYTGQGVAAVQQKMRLGPETLSHSWLRPTFRKQTNGFCVVPPCCAS